MSRTILVPLDGSAAAEHVLPYAQALAACASLGLTLAHIAPDDVVERRMRASYLEQLADSVRGAGPIAEAKLPVHVRVKTGHPVDGVLTLIENEAPDLVVMSAVGASHDAGGVERARQWLLGCVAYRVIRETSATVRLSRPRNAGGENEILEPERRILLLLDGSPLAEEMIPPTIAHAQRCGASVTLLRVTEPPYVNADYPEGTMRLTWGEHVRLFSEEVRKECLEYLERHAERFRAEGVDVSVDSASGQSTPRAVINYLADHPVDLVAMSTHGRGGVRRLVLGSVAQALIHSLPTPLLVARSR